MSGITLKFSAAKLVPNLPKPVITSSKIKRISFFVQIFLNFSKYPRGGTKTPVDPATGSTITAAIFSLPWKLTISSKASALSFPYFGCPHEKEFFSGICVWGKWITPFNKLPNCALLATIPPTEVPPNPDPWYPLDLPINFFFCFSHFEM